MHHVSNIVTLDCVASTKTRSIWFFNGEQLMCVVDLMAKVISTYNHVREPISVEMFGYDSIDIDSPLSLVTGGNICLDGFLVDGEKLLVVSEDCICLYESEDVFWGNVELPLDRLDEQVEELLCLYYFDPSEGDHESF